MRTCLYFTPPFSTNVFLQVSRFLCSLLRNITNTASSPVARLLIAENCTNTRKCEKAQEESNIAGALGGGEGLFAQCSCEREEQKKNNLRRRQSQTYF